MISLVRLGCGVEAEVVDIPHFHGFTHRLIGLGLTPGARLRVLQNRGRGPLIVEVRGSRVALGRGQAARVMVRPLPEGEDPEAYCIEPGAQGI